LICACLCTSRDGSLPDISERKRSVPNAFADVGKRCRSVSKAIIDINNWVLAAPGAVGDIGKRLPAIPRAVRHVGKRPPAILVSVFDNAKDHRDVPDAFAHVAIRSRNAPFLLVHINNPRRLGLSPLAPGITTRPSSIQLEN
jgi:hypothetical protein